MQNIQNTDTQVMSERVDKVEQQMDSVHFDQKEEADRVVGYTISRLKNEIMREVDKEVAALEVRMEVKMNEACQTTTTHL